MFLISIEFEQEAEKSSSKEMAKLLRILIEPLSEYLKSKMEPDELVMKIFGERSDSPMLVIGYTEESSIADIKVVKALLVNHLKNFLVHETRARLEGCLLRITCGTIIQNALVGQEIH